MKEMLHVAIKENIEKTDKEVVIKNYFLNNGILVEKNGALYFDREKFLQDLPWDTKTYNKLSRQFTRKELIEELSKIKAIPVDRHEDNTELENEGEELPIFFLPRSKEELLDGHVEDSILDISEIYKNVEWNREIILPDGTCSTILEVSLAKLFNKRTLIRDGEGLFFYDPRSGEKKSLTLAMLGNYLENELGINKSIGDGRGSTQKTFKSLANFVDAGIIRQLDFRNSSTIEGLQQGTDLRPRYFTKGIKPRYVSFAPHGISLRYYLGRENIVGTTTKINPETMSVVLLDSEKAAIVEDSFGRKEIITVIDLLSEEDSKKKQEETLAYLEEKDMDVSKANIASHAIVSGKVTKNIVRPYSTLEYLPEYLKDNPEKYTEKISRMSDVSFVLEDMREFFINNDINPLDFSWKDQMLVSANLREAKKGKSIREFISKFSTNGLKTFLSIEHGGQEMGDKILSLGEKLPKESAEKLFATYGEMTDAAGMVGDLLRNNLGDKATPEMVQQARESLLIKGKNLLQKYADQAQHCEGITCAEIGRQLQERLKLAKASVFAFSSACQTLVERGQFSFEDFKSAQLSYDRAPLPEAMKNQIITMHHENTKQYPDGLREYWRGTLQDGLETTNENQMIVSTKYQDDITAVMRVLRRDDGSWYGASFNVNPAVQGSRIGTELLKEVIHNLAKDKPFIADCYAENPMLDVYVHQFGFKITNTIENYHDTGATVHEITLSPREEIPLLDSIAHQK